MKPLNTLPPSGHLNTREAADYLRLSRSRLGRFRTQGGGPRFRKLGRTIVYTIADLEAWSAANAFSDTSEPDYPKPRARRS